MSCAWCMISVSFAGRLVGGICMQAYHMMATIAILACTAQVAVAGLQWPATSGRCQLAVAACALQPVDHVLQLARLPAYRTDTIAAHL